MASAIPAGGTPARTWLERPFPDSLPPRKRELAAALRALFLLLKPENRDEADDRPPTQAEAAKRLKSSATSLSRFLYDVRVPKRSFVEDLHKAACADASADGRHVQITLEELLVLRTRADGERRGCKNCADLGGRIDALTQRLDAPCPTCRAHQQERQENATQLVALRAEVAKLRAVVLEMQASEAGLRARLAMARSSRTPLPVPHLRRDRQRSSKEVAVARQLAAQASDLNSAGEQDAAFTLLRQGVTELLSPPETALVVLELRQHERDHHLADNLIHIYGRDQKDRDIMTVALELHEEGAVDDAGAVLRAALR